ncbi:MAG: glucose-6-phosphate isomerase family protein, partial [Candidatus Micrarchaeota archaeon]
NAPLELELIENFELLVQGAKHKVDVRTVRQMLDVVYDPLMARRMDFHKPLYYMFRDVKRQEDSALLENSSIRYDITVVPPIMIGQEYNKTYGHYHELATQKLTYPELYEVLYGEALYVVQLRQSTVSNEVLKVYLVHAKAGEKVLIPPNFGHVTINPSKTEPLVMANLVEAKFRSEYILYRQKKGAAMYVLEHEKLKNRNYHQFPFEEVEAKQFDRMVNPVIGTKIEEGNIYQHFLNDPKLFDFLKDPKLVEFRVPK